MAVDPATGDAVGFMTGAKGNSIVRVNLATGVVKSTAVAIDGLDEVQCK
jgi:hypothetical protein